MIDLSPCNTFLALNSVFQNHADLEKTSTKLNYVLSDLKDAVLLMVTDQIVILVATSLSVDRGDLVTYNSV